MSSGSGKHDLNGKTSREDEKQGVKVKPKSKKNKRKNKKDLSHPEIKGENSNERPKLGILESDFDCLPMAEEKTGDTIQVDEKVKTGEIFGKGWWTSNSKAEDHVISSGCATATGLEVTGNQTRLKFKDFYGDSDDDAEDEKNKTKETIKTSKSSALGATLEGAFSGLQIISNADKKPVEEGKKISSDSKSRWGKCSYCQKESNLLECSRCLLSSYCNKQCQKSDYQIHKFICRRKATFDMFLSKIPEVLKQPFLKKHGGFKVSCFLRDLPTTYAHACGHRGLIMAEITGPYFHIFRHGICIRDMAGEETFILFYIDSQYYLHRTDKAVKYFNVSECLRPGNFILLLDTCWHRFIDGTLGIRINHLDEVHFVFQN